MPDFDLFDNWDFTIGPVETPTTVNWFGDIHIHRGNYEYMDYVNIRPIADYQYVEYDPNYGATRLIESQSYLHHALYDKYYGHYTFKKGQKVVCKIEGSIDSFVNTGYDIEEHKITPLIKNKIYTIISVERCSCGKEKVRLEGMQCEEGAYIKCSCGAEQYSINFDAERFEKYVIEGYENYTTEQLKSYDFQKNLLTEFPERYKDIEPYLIRQIKEEFKEIVEMFNS